MDLKKYINDPQIQVGNIKTMLVNLGFIIEESRQSILVKAGDPRRQQLIKLYDTDQLDINSFITEANKKFAGETSLPLRKPTIFLSGKVISCGEITATQVLLPKPIGDKLGVGENILPHQEDSEEEKETPVQPPVKVVNALTAGETALAPVLDSLSESEQIDREITPQWRNLDPIDQEDWVDINVCGYQERPDGWAVAGASRRGKTHAHEGGHREDSFDFVFQDGWTILAAADGAGSYRLSRVGARISCQVAVENLKSLLQGMELKELIDAPIPSESDLLKIKQFLIDTILKVIQEVKNEAAGREVEFDLLSTTILVAVHHKWKDKSLVASIQIGDGIVAVWHGGTDVAVLGKADSGDFASETKFITTRGIEAELEHRVFFTIKPEVGAVAVMTDGIADDFFPAATAMPRMFELICENLIGSEKPAENLLNWLSYERRGSFDDRTIVILHRR